MTSLIIWYIVSVVVCLILFNLAAKLSDGYVDVSDLFIGVFLSLTPLVNVIVCGISLYEISAWAYRSSNFMKKVIF